MWKNLHNRDEITLNLIIVSAFVHEFETLFQWHYLCYKPIIQELITVTQDIRNID